MNKRKTKYIDYVKFDWIELLGVPLNIRLVENSVERRNDEEVCIFRFQRLAPKEFDAPYVSFVVNDSTGELLSFTNRMLGVPQKNISEKDAFSKASNIIKSINPEYYTGLSFLRIENPKRLFINMDGELEEYPIFSIKFSHLDGSYNWVSLSMNGQVIEYEIKAFWDFDRKRRKTEMWDHDGWVKARYGIGRELNPPCALARDY